MSDHLSKKELNELTHQLEYQKPLDHDLVWRLLDEVRVRRAMDKRPGSVPYSTAIAKQAERAQGQRAERDWKIKRFKEEHGL